MTTLARGRDPYLADLDHASLLTAAEEIALGRRTRAGDAAARERLIVANLRLAYSVAHRWPRHGVCFADMIQWANLGLVLAADRYDPERGLRFSTYAIHWIMQSLQRGRAEQAETIHVPHYVRASVNRVARATAGGRVDEGTAIAALGLKPRKASYIRAALARGPNAVVGFGEDVNAPQPLDPAPGPAEEVATADALRAMTAALRYLDKRSRDVVKARFGIGGPRQTFREIGATLGLSKEWVRRIEVAALAKLNTMMGG